MFGKLWQAVRPGVLWTYQRGSWQYDVMVAAILVFIFLTPKSFFHDQPRPASARQIEVLSGEEGMLVFLVDAVAIAGKRADEVKDTLRTLLRQRTGRDLEVIDTRPTANSEGEITGYLVYARP